MADAKVFVDPRITEEQDQPLRDLLAELGFTPRTRVLPTRRSGQAVTWLVLVALPLQAFLSGLGDRLSGDTYPRLKDVFRTLLGRETPPALHPVVLQDAATGLQIILAPDLPEDAVRQLCALDLSRFRFGPLRYDAVEGRWRSDLDEAQPHPR
jgi:hypothetical protein